MKLLSRSEEVILLAVWRLGDNAYGVPVRELVSKSTGYEWDFAAIYITLDRLTRKGFVHKALSEPVAERGGRSKCMYTVSKEGREALKSIHEVQNALWQGIADGAFDEEDYQYDK